MKDISIFVEGDGDKCFVRDFISNLCQKNAIRVDKSKSIDHMIISTGGWTVLNSEKGETIRNKMKQTTKRGGTNLVVFDADDDVVTRTNELEQCKKKYNISFEIFLWPNNEDSGTFEDLLVRLINSDNQSILDCWERYEDDLTKQKIVWKIPPIPTIPSSKSKIYIYLETLVGTTKSEKEKIKDRNRNFRNLNHWYLDGSGGKALADFLLQYL